MSLVSFKCAISLDFCKLFFFLEVAPRWLTCICFPFQNSFIGHGQFFYSCPTNRAKRNYDQELTQKPVMSYWREEEEQSPKLRLPNFI